ncbi:YtxH domain-containing protein [Mucilaginibacter arboris]|uniref:YtxH domain-containing protein n=1 Tax=Mucilaginibacter arboris TaxID=2682090 RepID=A0A7K1SZQ0_9SPHI|nr:YtxH domain-containing protein [Mucilaginibacter arboris]MVN22792.1 YtxH domain-containing protein [Mucilaginibacter arboris]
MKSSVETLGVFLLGTAVGAALGILFAPEAGEETRNTLVETATNSWDSIKEKIKTGEDELNQYKDQAVEYKDQVVDQAKSKVKEYKDQATGYKDQVVDQAKSKVKDEAAGLNDKIQQA